MQNLCQVRAMSNLFEHCRTAAKFAVLRSNSEQKRVKVFMSLQTEAQPSLRHCAAMANKNGKVIASLQTETQPSLRCCEATANKNGKSFCKFTDRTAADFAALRSICELGIRN